MQAPFGYPETVLMLDQALIRNQISSVMMTCYENDRPLQGLIGELDWRFNGHFSTLLKKQILTGAAGEVLYSPLLWNERTYHFLILGVGYGSSVSDRKERARTLFESALAKAAELKLSNLALSTSEWGISETHPLINERRLWILN